jgi:hypothetical protein
MTAALDKYNDPRLGTVAMFVFRMRQSFLPQVFWAPNGTRLSARCHLTGPKKLENSRAQPPPTSPRNGYARIQNIMHGAV